MIEPAIRANRKVRQNMERAKTLFVMTVDCPNESGNDKGASGDDKECLLLSLGLSVMRLL